MDIQNTLATTNLLKLIPPNARCLVEVGAKDSLLAERYKQAYPASFLHGISEAKDGNAWCDLWHDIALDKAELSFFKRFGMVDGWIFDQSLEQLADPLTVLRQIRASLALDACVVCCIRNPQYIGGQALLAGGDLPDLIEVSPSAVDSDHAALALFAAAGYRIHTAITLGGVMLDEVVNAIERRCAKLGIDPQQALLKAGPSFFLIKAMPDGS